MKSRDPCNFSQDNQKTGNEIEKYIERNILKLMYHYEN